MKISNPFILNRADPHISLYDGQYHFTASVPEYDRIVLRRSPTLAGLVDAGERTLWAATPEGPTCSLVWAPELHRIDGTWFVYFAVAPSREIRDDLFQHRMYALRCRAVDPMQGEWELAGQVDSGIDAFCLDATSFAHRGVQYYLWAQKHPDIPGNSNLYLAPLRDGLYIEGEPVMLTRPEFDWEVQGFLVNEGPSVLIRHGRVFVTYSASATDERYAMGLLWADADADLLDPASWHKSPAPVFVSDAEREVFGPGHNSFTLAPDGVTDLLVYHARNYTRIEGDPLWNPDRHTCIQPLRWDADGMPVFGRPQREVEIPEATR
ncbi:family 43 glycosylhydrolase [Luteimonas composti]|uniref:Family 43 glycosylhydrolase n=1 Tax=Luteimonas composti TaxID=398257 RepID=A0ABT6MN74_9GAMM|nr:family 43 glycosylhydrolase [Luteimonas composti]MDH7452037.1 family 43 glycosylhydrolase [Luteimonas composti]